MFRKEILLFSILCQILKAYGGRCPSSEIIYPCVCNETAIVCGGNDPINIKRTFREMFLALDQRNANSFDTFELSNKAITELPDNTFFNITFRRILINDARNLKRISSHAFSLYNMLTIEEIDILGDSMLGDDQNAAELFAAIVSLVNLNQFSFHNFNNQLSKIPAHAFDPVYDMQRRLSYINFGHQNHAIESIEDYAFYYLTNLTFLTFWPKQIGRIELHAFDFWKPSDSELYIDLSVSGLNSSNLEIGAFSNAKRPIIVDLQQNNFTSIDERLFRPILEADKRNSLGLEYNPLACDCRMYWLYRDRSIFAKQIRSEMICKDGRSFFDMTERDFSSC